MIMREVVEKVLCVESIQQQQQQVAAVPSKGRRQPSRVVAVMESPDIDGASEGNSETNSIHQTEDNNYNNNNPLESWLPVTESRDGNACTSTFHLLSSGIGFLALALPVAFTALGWFWGIVCLSLGFGWQLYTIWLLVHLHEPVPGTRHSRYILLAKAAFGENMGKLLALYPVVYLSGGSCLTLIIVGGRILEQLYQTMCGDDQTCKANTLSGVEWLLIFTVLAILVALFFPNLDSIAGISLTGAISAVGYCTLLWVLSISKGRLHGASHAPSNVAPSQVARIRGVLSAFGILALAFRGHNLVLEIQGTLPSSPKHRSNKPMWRGVIVSYLLISMCLFPMAIGGYWAYGNTIIDDGDMLTAFSNSHKHTTSKYVMGLTYLLVLISFLCSFQIYAMIVFDNWEFIYVMRKKKQCPRWVRSGIKVLFGGVAFFIAVALPFLVSLAPLMGGITMPLTYAYPCFMWIAIKKAPSSSSASMWWFNLCLGCLGILFSVLSVVAAVRNLVTKGLNANFFHPHHFH